MEKINKIYGLSIKFDFDIEKDLTAKLATIKDAPKPTSWAEESPAAYEKIVALVGEANIGLIPYVYDAAYSGNFDDGKTNDAGTMVSIKLKSGTFTDAYRLAITEACVALGFTKVSNTKATLAVDGKTLTVSTLGSTFAVLFK